MKQGNIGVTTENIFPVIKKFLYSDHEIFIREIVSNAVDACQKLKTLAGKGDFAGELGDLTVRVSFDADAHTITVSDRGIGMTAEEIDKYINQIAFSGANDFLDKYKDDAAQIIGHFGLGFYSSFMVSDKVEIITRSYRDDAKAQRWSCDGTPNFTLEDVEKADRGTDIIMHLSEDCHEFAHRDKLQGLLNKYCRFLPIPVALGKKTEWKDGKQVETDEDNVINDSEPIWTKKPADLKDEDYTSFYRKLYPMSDEPLFWIHLNVDFPFNLTGVLYFPRIKNQIELQKGKIQLFCNQVFVTDNVEGIVPDFLALLHGVIDSPDIPLNVSRSYLQSDQNVKKISSYITKKVSDRLQSIFKSDRKQFEEKWDVLKIFIHYGMLTQEDFYDKAKAYALLRDTDDKYYTLDEYATLVKDNQTDKDSRTIYLYANDRDAQFAYIADAKARGYNVLLLNGELDTPLMQMLESKLEKTSFVRVDSDTIDNLIKKEDDKREELDEARASLLSGVFRSQMPKADKVNYNIQTRAMGADAQPAVITQSEYMRRMKDMARIQPGMAFYGEMPDMYDLVLNTDNAVVKAILEDIEGNTSEALKPIDAEIRGLEARQSILRKEQEGKKADEISQEQKDDLKATGEALTKQQGERDRILADYGTGAERVHQLIDLALLQNGLLRGEALQKFIQRSVSLL